ncbi:Receptor-type guanylate cyclase gcy [Seminavis robusta]|uniref:Receptor-type guanylate cyclase gcy n=1 Tax=Seminavis robusta TaxID=568900 RepID=A0A9N8HT57_9STRA|nr:Receptor-type guanylate cyclase gcy [Seminavis robusta]|eukprot:Sro1824_g300010.1 Receptor-type guanylate cyclase gcy (1099) ;mRNA; f:11905-15865
MMVSRQAEHDDVHTDGVWIAADANGPHSMMDCSTLSQSCFPTPGDLAATHAATLGGINHTNVPPGDTPPKGDAVTGHYLDNNNNNNKSRIPEEFDNYSAHSNASRRSAANPEHRRSPQKKISRAQSWSGDTIDSESRDRAPRAGRRPTSRFSNTNNSDADGGDTRNSTGTYDRWSPQQQPRPRIQRPNRPPIARRSKSQGDDDDYSYSGGILSDDDTQNNNHSPRGRASSPASFQRKPVGRNNSGTSILSSAASSVASNSSMSSYGQTREERRDSSRRLSKARKKKAEQRRYQAASQAPRSPKRPDRELSSPSSECESSYDASLEEEHPHHLLPVEQPTSGGGGADSRKSYDSPPQQPTARQASAVYGSNNNNMAASSADPTTTAACTRSSYGSYDSLPQPGLRKDSFHGQNGEDYGTSSIENNKAVRKNTNVSVPMRHPSRNSILDHSHDEQDSRNNSLPVDSNHGGGGASSMLDSNHGGTSVEQSEASTYESIESSHDSRSAGVRKSKRGSLADHGRRVSLADIFPKHVAQALKDGKRVKATHKDCVTIFFSDIVGFTDISSTLPPAKVAGMLHRLYKKLDRLSIKHDIYKVETIGDAFMAVANLVKDQEEDHAKRIAEFAIEAVAAAGTVLIDRDDADRGCVSLRIGFHSGAVVADVVGTRNPRYCLFGDTVNTASRMESNGKPGRIHCSMDSARLLEQQCPGLPIHSRGLIDVKGKGQMHTFWVNEETVAPSYDDTQNASRRTSKASKSSSKSSTRESLQGSCHCDPPKRPQRRGSWDEEEQPPFHEPTCPHHHDHGHHHHQAPSSKYCRETQNDYNHDDPYRLGPSNTEQLRDRSPAGMRDTSRQSGLDRSGYVNASDNMSHNSHAIRSISAMSVVSDITDFTGASIPVSTGGNSRPSIGHLSHYHDERQMDQIPEAPAYQRTQTWSHPNSHPSNFEQPQPYQMQQQHQYQPAPPPNHHIMQQPYHAPPPPPPPHHQMHQSFQSHYPTPPHHQMQQQYQVPHPSHPPPPASNPLKVEIEPGVFRTLRGKDETLHAMECGFMIDLSCMVCTMHVSCIADAEFVLCPVCKSVSPIVNNTGNGGGVGLGVEPDDNS